MVCTANAYIEINLLLHFFGLFIGVDFVTLEFVAYFSLEDDSVSGAYQQDCL
jgi:hypothetical protein